MYQTPERIKWAPRIHPKKIQELYESDARGFRDDDLCNDVGFRLYMRCQTILMVSKGEVTCPRCGRIFIIDMSARETVSVCPTEGCDWQTTRLVYQQSWSKKRIWGANALPVFKTFHERFSPRLPYQQKLLLIDRLIHSFHWDLKERKPNRTAANNLIEGSHDQVVQFLDQLTGVHPETKANWCKTKDEMMRRRKGQ